MPYQPVIAKPYQPIATEFNRKSATNPDTLQPKPKPPPNLTREFYVARDGYPPNQGFVPGEARIGSPHTSGKVLGRQGSGWGRFTTPDLNPKSGVHSVDPKTARLPHQQYEVMKKFQSVDGPAAPAWSQPGGGQQNYHAQRIHDLVLNGYLRKLPEVKGGNESGGSK